MHNICSCVYDFFPIRTPACTNNSTQCNDPSTLVPTQVLYRHLKSTSLPGKAVHLEKKLASSKKSGRQRPITSCITIWLSCIEEKINLRNILGPYIRKSLNIIPHLLWA